MEGSLHVTAGQRVRVHTYVAPAEGSGASSHVLELLDRVVLVDLPLLAPHCAEVLARVADLAKPIDRVYLTNARPDHFAGTVLLDRPVYAAPGVRRAINLRGAALVRAASRRLPTVASWAPSVGHTALEGPVPIGDVVLRLHRVGIGDQLVIEIVGESMVITGDVVGTGSPPAGLGGSRRAAWLEDLGRVRELGNTVVLPGHGAPGGVELYEAMRQHLINAQDG